MITVDGTDSIVLQNVQAANLHADDFIFPRAANAVFAGAGFDVGDFAIIERTRRRPSGATQKRLPDSIPRGGH